MGTITLQFVEGSGLGAGMIKWFGHGKYSHVDCVLPSGSLLGARSDKIGSIPPGVQVRPFGYTKKEKTTQVTLVVAKKQEEAFYSFVTHQLGRAYNKLGIVAFAFATDWTTEGEFFCSQLVAEGLRAAGLLKNLSEPANKIDPDDLRLLISAVWGV